MKHKIVALLLLGLLVSPCLIRAQDTSLRVAVFPFESKVDKGSSLLKKFIQRAQKEMSKEESHRISLGDKISELLAAELSEIPTIELVERAKIDMAFDELALSKTGIIDDNSAAKIGNLLGAQVLITGKAFPLDDELFIVTKVLGVETGRVFAAKSNGLLTGKLAPMVSQLSGKVQKILLKHDTQFIAKEVEKKDFVALIKKAIGNQKLPKVSVFVTEQHMQRASSDPAAETELIYLLQKSGFEVIDEKNRQISDWASAYLEDSKTTPPLNHESDVYIIGEAFSEFAIRRGDLVSCKARVELRAIDAKYGAILSIERTTGTEVDIAEHIAAKSALQKATQGISVNLIPEVVKQWNKKR